MHLSPFTTYLILSLPSLCLGSPSAPPPLPAIAGPFTTHQVQHPNGSTVSLHLHSSYHHHPGDGDDGKATTNHSAAPRRPRRRFHKTYNHNATHAEICAETTFVATSTADSALSSDCSAIAAGLRADPGFFATGDYAAGQDYNYLAVCGTCAFGVRSRGAGEVDVGSKDVVDNIDVSVLRFDRGGRVGATGSFACGGVPVDWAVLRAA